jgi:cytochrome c biogenesis protein CcmG/thiol:disulfide interchange protein DsbE
MNHRLAWEAVNVTGGGRFRAPHAKMAGMDSALRTPSAAARRWVRTTLVVIPALLVVGVLAWATLEEGPAPQPGDEAPAFTAPRLDGSGSISLEELRGRPVLLNFWASWCVPCEAEAPILNRAERAYGEDVAFLGINIKDARDDALAFERRFDVPYPSVRDEAQAIYDDYGLTGQPESFLLDSDGRIVEHIPGQIPNQSFLNGLLEATVGSN